MAPNPISTMSPSCIGELTSSKGGQSPCAGGAERQAVPLAQCSPIAGVHPIIHNWVCFGSTEMLSLLSSAVS